jgi:hypothetical protein
VTGAGRGGRVGRCRLFAPSDEDLLTVSDGRPVGLNDVVLGVAVVLGVVRRRG